MELGKGFAFIINFQFSIFYYQRLVHRDPPIAEEFIGENLDKFILLEITIKPGDIADPLALPVFCNLLAFVTQRTGHLFPEVVKIQFTYFDKLFVFCTCGVDQLNLAPASTCRN